MTVTVLEIQAIVVKVFLQMIVEGGHLTIIGGQNHLDETEEEMKEKEIGIDDRVTEATKGIGITDVVTEEKGNLITRVWHPILTFKRRILITQAHARAVPMSTRTAMNYSGMASSGFSDNATSIHSKST